MIKIEVLYNEVCNLFGDTFNIKYLSNTIKNSKVIYTSLNEKPKFIDEDIDMVYISPMSEKTQEIVINKLKPYVEDIKKYIDSGKIFFAVGNALEIFGDYIENEDKSKIEGLHITGLYAKRNMMNRYNSLYLGSINNIKVVGYKSQFSMSYDNNDNNYLFKTIRGDGINKKSKNEGIRINNFFGTYLLGPLFVFNPYFTKYILELLNVDSENILYEEDLINCYEERLKVFENPKTKY